MGETLKWEGIKRIALVKRRRRWKPGVSGKDKSLTYWSSILSRPRACVHMQRPRSQDLISALFITAQKKKKKNKGRVILQ